jgi:hypothetical protein
MRGQPARANTTASADFSATPAEIGYGHGV